MAEATRERITSAEFLRGPETMTPTQLINGEVIVSPSPKNQHQDCVLAVAVFLRQAAAAGLVKIAPLDLVLDDYTTVQPEVFWVRTSDSGAQLGPDGYWYGAPELVVEVLSSSTALYDRGAKLAAYERAGIGEYWLIDPEGRFLEVFRLADGRFVRAGIYGEADSFTAPLLGEVTVPVAALFGAPI